jgi:cell division transport system permease protein
MFKLNAQRIIKAGFVNFWRNAFVSVSAMLVMTITLFTIGALIFFGAVLNSSLLQIKDKVDINVYFLTSASESDILTFKKTLDALPQVQSSVYLSSDQVLENFKQRNQNDQLTLQALDELGGNPLGAVLNVKAKDPSQYEGIYNFLKPYISDPAAASGSSEQIIEKANFNQNKTAIDTLTKVINSSRKLGTFISLILVVISTLIAFNTIRLAIYTSKEEISVMRLVGANNMFIRGPFIVEGSMYGFFSALFVLIIFYPLLYWIGPYSAGFFGGLNLFTYYLHNFLQLFIILMGSGIAIGAVSSFLAVRKYLQV